MKWGDLMDERTREQIYGNTKFGAPGYDDLTPEQAGAVLSLELAVSRVCAEHREAFRKAFPGSISIRLNPINIDVSVSAGSTDE